MNKNSGRSITDASSAFFISMNITQLSYGDHAVITSVKCSSALKERLRSLNIREGAWITLVKISFFHKTYLLRVGGSSIAVRREVAECVSVEKR